MGELEVIEKVLEYVKTGRIEEKGGFEELTLKVRAMIEEMIQDYVNDNSDDIVRDVAESYQDARMACYGG